MKRNRWTRRRLSASSGQAVTRGKSRHLDWATERRSEKAKSKANLPQGTQHLDTALPGIPHHNATKAIMKSYAVRPPSCPSSCHAIANSDGGRRLAGRLYIPLSDAKKFMDLGWSLRSEILIRILCFAVSPAGVKVPSHQRHFADVHIEVNSLKTEC